MSLMGDYIKEGLSANDLKKELEALINKYNEYRKSYLIVYSGAINKRNIPDITLCMDDYYIIYDMLRSIDAENLDFYIETPGGSGEAAEEIVRFLRKKFNEIWFVVSGEAKSAGTLIVLSGDEYLLTESGSLGPIDAQVKIGRSVISAHDYTEWVKEKQKAAEKHGKLNPFDATMVAQISPGELEGVSNSLAFAQDLVVEWLTNYKFKNWKVTEDRKIPVTPQMKEQRAKEIAEELCNHEKWRSHGRSIKISDLEEIKLKIKKADEDEKISDIIYRIQTVIRLLFSTTSCYKLFATKDNIILKQAVMSKEQKSIPTSKEDPAVAEFHVKCQKCGNIHKMFAKLVDDKKMVNDLKKQGLKPVASNKLICDCGFETDLTGIINDIETKTNKKIIKEEGEDNNE